MPARILLVLVLNGLIALPSLLSQTSSPPPVDPNRPVIHTTTPEMLLDMVVRDKHHHAVTDLRPEEVEIYEDGVRQNIRVFSNIQGKEQMETERSVAGARNAPAAINSGEKPRSLNSLRQVNFV